MISASNQPAFTAKSPRMSAPMMLKELLSELGVLRLAIFMASMPISRMISCQNMLMFAPPSISVNLNTSGIRSGLLLSQNHTGVRNCASRKIRMRMIRRYVPISGGK